jgi:hypothetical protein
LGVSSSTVSYWPPEVKQDLADFLGADHRGALRMVGRGEHVHAGVVLLDVGAEQLGVDPVKVLDQVDQVELGLDPEQQRDFAQLGVEVHDQRALVAEAAELDGKIGHDRRGAGATLGAEEPEGPGHGPAARPLG